MARTGGANRGEGVQQSRNSASALLPISESSRSGSIDIIAKDGEGNRITLHSATAQEHRRHVW
jgi:hypothetical protein